MQDIKSIILQRYKNTPILAIAEKSKILSQFKRDLVDIIGDKALNNIVRTHLKDKIIYFVSASPALAQEINLRKIQLIDRINQAFKRIAVVDIKLTR